MRTPIGWLVTLIAAVALSPAWANAPAGEGGPGPSLGTVRSILKRAADAVAVARSSPDAEAIVPARAVPGAKTVANGLYMSGRFTYSFSSGSVTVTLDRINNDSLAMTGALRLELWATAVRPARAEGFSGYRMATFSTFSALLPRTYYSDITRTATATEPPAGTYWLVLVLSEWDATYCPAADHYCIEDSFVSQSQQSFNAVPPSETVTLASPTDPICFENIPAEVAAQLQQQYPGMYVSYPYTTTCASLGLDYFAGYLADTGNTVRVYTDNAANAALICSTNLVVGCTGGTPAGSYTDLWWNPSESGWGVCITHHTSGVAFVSWYTYDAVGNPKWYVVSNCPMTGTGCTGTLFETTGPPFGPTFDPSRVVARAVGSLTFTFSSQNAGTMRYSVNGQTGTKAISRQPF